jgi:hypothetical protein
VERHEVAREIALNDSRSDPSHSQNGFTNKRDLTTIPPATGILQSSLRVMRYFLKSRLAPTLRWAVQGVGHFAEDFFRRNLKEIIVQFKKIIAAASVILATSMTMAEPAPKAIDLSKLYGRFEKSGYSSLDLMETTKRVLISGVALDVSQSFSGNSILKVGAHANSQELARLTAADDTQEHKLKALQAGAKFKAICDLAFSSEAQYLSFQGCVFK